MLHKYKVGVSFTGFYYDTVYLEDNELEETNFTIDKYIEDMLIYNELDDSGREYFEQIIDSIEEVE
jgi:hypothetical protein